MKSQINYPTSIEFIEGDFFQIEFTKKFDFIVALDVLEHISLNDLPLYIDQMKKILNPNGYIVVSGPTENILYKILIQYNFLKPEHAQAFFVLRLNILKLFKISNFCLIQTNRV